MSEASPTVDELLARLLVTIDKLLGTLDRFLEHMRAEAQSAKGGEPPRPPAPRVH